MKREIDLNIKNSEHPKLVRWFERWGHRKWQYVFFHQVPVIAGWNVYFFFKNHDLSLYPINLAEFLQVVFRELPILLTGLIFWTVMKVRHWNSLAFRVTVLNKKGMFPVEGSYHLKDAFDYTHARMKSLTTWHNRWSEKKFLFHVLHTIAFSFLIILLLSVIEFWQKGDAWMNVIYPSEWPVYLLVIGLPLLVALYVTVEIWRQKESEYLISVRLQKTNE